MLRKILIIYCLLFLYYPIIAQNNGTSHLDTLLVEAVTKVTKSDFTNGLKELKAVAEQAEKQGNYRVLTVAKLNTGLLYHYLNESEKALNYYFLSLDIAHEHKLEKLYNSIYNNIGIIYSNNNDKQKAKEYFVRALQISQKLEEPFKVGINKINISNILSDLDKSDSALMYLREAETIFKGLDEKGNLAAIYNNIGNIQYEQQKYLLAKQNYLKAYRMSLAHSSKTYQNIFAFNVGKSYEILDKPDSAVYFLHECIRLASAVNNKANLVNSFKHLAEIYGQKGLTDSALINYKNSLAWKDSILVEKSQKWVSEMQMKYDFAKKENEIVFLEKKNDLYRTLWIISVVIVAVIAFLIYYSYRNRNIRIKQKNELLRKQKEVQTLELQKSEAENKCLVEEITANEEITRLKQEQLKQEIEFKNREITSNALHIVNKNEILSGITKLLNEIDFSNLPQNRRKVQEIKNLINTNSNIDEDWRIFKMHFEKVHVNFFNRLHTDYPDLTQSDLRLCVYLIINLNNKEIAQIFNIAPDSVRKRRQRLREKLGTQKDEGIIDILSKYL